MNHSWLLVGLQALRNLYLGSAFRNKSFQSSSSLSLELVTVSMTTSSVRMLLSFM